MESDAAMLEVDPPELAPMSNAYHALNVFHPNSINSKHPVTKKKYPKVEAKDLIDKCLRASLKKSGFKPADVDAMLKDKEYSEDMQEAYKEAAKAMIKAKKDTEDYEEGRFPNLDKI